MLLSEFISQLEVLYEIHGEMDVRYMEYQSLKVDKIVVAEYSDQTKSILLESEHYLRG